MTARARYDITVEEAFMDEDSTITLRDVGPWDKHPTITNDVEAVVEDLIRQGLLPAGRRLLYVDSDGNTDEILVADGKFAGFKPGPGR